RRTRRKIPACDLCVIVFGKDGRNGRGGGFERHCGFSLVMWRLKRVAYYRELSRPHWICGIFPSARSTMTGTASGFMRSLVKTGGNPMCATRIFPLIAAGVILGACTQETVEAKTTCDAELH